MTSEFAEKSTSDLSANAAIARETGFALAAVDAMKQALTTGGGRMAQFDHPELGGLGQWMQGGLVMTSTGRDAAFEARIDRLCEALCEAMATPTADERRADEATRPAKQVAQAGIDPFVALERLEDLRARGIVSDAEFTDKKTELLGRI